MKICAVTLTDEKLARAVEACLKLAGIPLAEKKSRSGRSAAEEPFCAAEEPFCAAEELVCIADEKSAAALPENASAVLVLYRDERWLHSAATRLTERYGSAFAAMRRPTDFGSLAERILLLPARGNGGEAEAGTREERTLPEKPETPEEKPELPPETPDDDPQTGRQQSGSPPQTNPQPPANRSLSLPPYLTADPAKGTVSLGEKEVRLTEREMALFLYFQDHAGQLVTRKELREAVWHGEADPTANVTDVYVSYLRKKLSILCGEEPGAGAGVLTSVRGKGYLFRNAAP